MLGVSNLSIKSTKSAENISISHEKKLPMQKKLSSNEFSPNLKSKSGSKNTNLNNDSTSYGEDIGFIKNEILTPLRKDTNFSLNMVNNNSTCIRTCTYNASLGKIQDGMAVLLGDDMNLLELPLELLPMGSKKGNIFKICIERNIQEEEVRKDSILNIQKEVLENSNFFKSFD